MKKNRILVLGIILFMVLIVACSFEPAPGSNVIVYRTNTGDKYHNAGCQYLAHSSIKITLAQAISLGLGPCSVCRPPTLATIDPPTQVTIIPISSDSQIIGRWVTAGPFESCIYWTLNSDGTIVSKNIAGIESLGTWSRINNVLTVVWNNGGGDSWTCSISSSQTVITITSVNDGSPLELIRL